MEPQPFANRGGREKAELTSSFTKEGENFDNLFEDIIIEYKASAGSMAISQNDKIDSYTHLKTYASVGIPTEMYNKLLDDARLKLGEQNVKSAYYYANSKYTWVTADINSDISCDVYSSGSRQVTFVGSLHDTMERLKSNVRGFARLKIHVYENKFCYLKFTLTGFQLIDKTNVSSTRNSYVLVDVSDSLKKQLNVK